MYLSILFIQRVGCIDFDLSEYVSAGSDPRSETLTLKLQKTKEKNSVITCKITTKKRGEAENEEEVSRSTNREEGSSVEHSEDELSSQHHSHDSEEPSEVHDDTHDDDSDDSKRRVQFNEQPAPKTATNRNSVDPKKSNLKSATVAASTAVAVAATPAVPVPDDDDFDNDIPFFQVNLSSIMEAQAETNPDLPIPIILDCLIRGLERMNAMSVEGIFRLSVPAAKRDELKQKFEQGDYSLRVKDPHILANLLKHWLAELKLPVIEEKLTDICLQIGNWKEENEDESEEEDRKKKKKKKYDSDDDDDDDSDDGASRRKKPSSSSSSPDPLLQQLCNSLPTINRLVLLRICNFINKCCLPDYTATSKMSLHAFAVVFTPNIIRLKTEKKSNSQAFAEVTTHCNIKNQLTHMFVHVHFTHSIELLFECDVCI